METSVDRVPVRLFAASGLLLLIALGCARHEVSAVELAHWNRNETFWTSPRGHRVTLFGEPLSYNPDRQVVVCETFTPKLVFVLPPESVALVSGNMLNIFESKNYATPGWYRVTRTHGLTWWERSFTEKSLGGWEWIKDQKSLPVPTAGQSLAIFVSW